MKTIAVSRPALSWATMLNLANKYHVQLSIAGHKIIIRSGCAEDLVRFVSMINVLNRG